MGSIDVCHVLEVVNQGCHFHSQTWHVIQSRSLPVEERVGYDSKIIHHFFFGGGGDQV